MRLRWETAVPADAARAWQALGVPAATEGDRLEVVLDGSTIELVAGPQPRLRLIDDAAPASASATDPTPASAARLHLGIASVDVERYAIERGWAISPLAPDALLGAFAWAVAMQPAMVLLEPNTEGRLAATLARHDEGPVALYLNVRPATQDVARARLRSQGIVTTTLASGPFGEEFLVLGGPASGPHLIGCGP